MLSWLSTLLSGILGFFNDVLPDSPFQDVLQGAEDLQMGLAWLNWLIPVGDMLGIFLAYLAVLLIWAAVDFAFSKGEKGVFSMIGGSS